jgi:hypothetical protein
MIRLMSPASDEAEPLARLAGWLEAESPRMVDQVHVSRTKRATGIETRVRIDHRLPSQIDQYDGWHIRTRRTFLPPSQFGSHARMCIKNANARRGRAIYCYEPTSEEVVAAATYHIDQKGDFPVLLTTLAFRTDTDDTVGLLDRTLAGALVLKHHLHAVAEKIGRGGHIDIDLADPSQEPLLRQLGFRKAPQIPGFKPAKRHLRQRAPGQDSGGG